MVPPFQLGGPQDVGSHVFVGVGGGLVLTELPKLTDGTPLVGAALNLSLLFPILNSDKHEGALAPATGIVLAAPAVCAGWLIEALLNYADHFGLASAVDSHREQARAWYRDNGGR